MKILTLTKVIISSTIILFTALACKNKQPEEAGKKLADTDRFYSALSVEKGMNAAFIAMFDSAGVLLRPNHNPIEGIDAIRQLLSSQNDSSFTLKWEPVFARVAASGDLGYTYGTYQVIDKASDSVTGEGTYATVWQKQDDGEWKALLDTGNPGLGQAE